MCVSRAVCVRTGLQYTAATLWPSVRWSESRRRGWRHRSTPFLPHWRAPESLCVCVCVYSSDFLLIRVFPDAKRLKGRLSCQDVYYPGSWTSHRVRGISNSLLEDWCRWHFKLTERWSDRWVERRMSGEEVSDGFWDCVCFDYSLLSHGTYTHVGFATWIQSGLCLFFNCVSKSVITDMTSHLSFYLK